MKILLIYPPSRHIITTTLPESINRARGFNPPLGLCYLAAVIQEKTEHEVAILDTQVEELDDKDIELRIANYAPDFVGIQTMTMTLIDVIKTVQIARRVAPLAKVALGGPHVSIYPEQSAKLDGVDFAVVGEGEETIIELIKNLVHPERLQKISGLAFKTNGKTFVTPQQTKIGNLDSLPLPARELTPYRKYWSILSKQAPLTTMISSRGCPFNCIFCERFSRTYRALSPRRVLEEIQSCVDLGIQYIFFYDDLFTLQKSRVLELCDLINSSGLKVRWEARSRVDTVSREILVAMKRAGCKRISFGVESGSPKVLKALRKDISLEKTKQIFCWCHEIGLNTLADFMIGSPSETLEDIEMSVALIKLIKPTYVQFSVTVPYPGTDLYRTALERGIIKNDVWADFARNPQPFEPPLWEENFTRQELLNLLKKCYRQFYLSPGFILKDLLRTQSLKVFRGKVQATFSLLTNKKF